MAGPARHCTAKLARRAANRLKPLIVYCERNCRLAKSCVENQFAVRATTLQNRDAAQCDRERTSMRVERNVTRAGNRIA